jgi:hypothetical protein
LTLTKGVNSGRCAMAEGILKALQGTPIPTLLVVAGIVFLLLSIAGQLAGRIVVPPERQRQATIIGGLLLVVGVALNIAPPQWLPSKPSNDSGVPPPRDTEPRQKAEIKPPPPLPPGPGQEFPTKYPGVMASIARFGTSGAFIILEITVKNGTNKDVRVCGVSQLALLYDRDTSESWKPVNAGGSLAGCGHIPPSGEGGMWTEYKIPDSDKRGFLLGSALFDRRVENLVLGKSP